MPKPISSAVRLSAATGSVPAPALPQSPASPWPRPSPPRAPQPPVYQAKAEFFRILGHPVRVRTLELLRDGERPVPHPPAPPHGAGAGWLAGTAGLRRFHGVAGWRPIWLDASFRERADRAAVRH